MEKKINITELLKDCPKGMELNCTTWENVTFEKVVNDEIYVKRNDKAPSFNNIVILNRYGCTTYHEDEKCRIFPKGKTTWEGFQRPFVDGDIIADDHGNIAIYKGTMQYNKKLADYYCGYRKSDDKFLIKGYRDGHFGMIEELHYASKEEKQKLFDVIKDSGYKWNTETKALEELVEPRFKVGNWVTDGVSKCQIHFIDDTQYWYSENCILGSIESVDKQYHLWTIQDAKDGDVIFYDEGWTCIFKRIHGIWYSSYCFITSDGEFHTGYEEHAVDSTINGKAHLATKEQSNLLFQKMKEAGYKWNPETKTLEKLVEPGFKVGDIIQDIDTYKVKITEVNIEDECYGYESMIAKGIGSIPFSEQNDWELVPNNPNKFDINTLKPFDKVLVRDNDRQKWTIDFFGFMDDNKGCPFVCVGHYTTQCIPYEGNEHLIRTTNNCDDFYKTWEK